MSNSDWYRPADPIDSMTRMLVEQMMNEIETWLHTQKDTGNETDTHE